MATLTKSYDNGGQRLFF